jgi:hypothetical protein
MRKLTLWLDLDGVLADFDRRAREMCGDAIVDDKDRGDELWSIVHKDPHLYRDLTSCIGSMSLWLAACATGWPVKILTAIPRRTTMPHAEADKRAWCARLLGPTVPVEIGPYSRDKWKHCKPGDILIDDRADNIDDWVKKGGGVGILHTSVGSTLAQLAELMKAGMPG